MPSQDGRQWGQAEAVFETDLPLYLPEDYIPGASERLQIYREIDGLKVSSDSFAHRLKDRFGPLPKPVEDLLKVPSVRTMATALGVERMEARGGTLTL